MYSLCTLCHWQRSSSRGWVHLCSPNHWKCCILPSLSQGGYQPLSYTGNKFALYVRCRLISVSANVSAFMWGFTKIEVPPAIIHLNGTFPYKPSIWGYLRSWKASYPHVSTDKWYATPAVYTVHLTSGWKFRNMRTLSLPKIQNSKKSRMKYDGLYWTKGRKHTVLQWQSDVLSHPAALADTKFFFLSKRCWCHHAKYGFQIKRMKVCATQKTSRPAQNDVNIFEVSPVFKAIWSLNILESDECCTHLSPISKQRLGKLVAGR